MSRLLGLLGSGATILAAAVVVARCSAAEVSAASSTSRDSFLLSAGTGQPETFDQPTAQAGTITARP